MAAITGTVLGVGAALYGANKQAGAAKDAAKAQQAGTDASIAESQRQFDLIRQDNAPFQAIGTGAANQLANIYGIPTSSPNGFVNQQGQTTANPSAAGAPDYSSFYKSPDYQFTLDQGKQAIERTAAARGGLASGNTLAALTQFGQGLASQNFNAYTNRLAGLAGVGQTANSSNASAGLATGANVGNALIAGGNARASGITDAANAWGNAAGDIAGFAGNYLRNRNLRRTQPIPGYSVGTGPY